MLSIAQVVEKVVKHKPYLAEAMAMGIINISALARQIMPEVERIVGRQANMGAIVMALNRLMPCFQHRERESLSHLLNGMGDIILRSNLCDYTFKNSPALLDCHIRMLKMIHKREEIFYTMVQGVFETNLVVSDVMMPIVDNCFREEQCLYKCKGLSSVTVKLPKGNILQPGFYYAIMRELSWEGINLSEVISSTNEFTVVVDNELIDKTFMVLKNMTHK